MVPNFFEVVSSFICNRAELKVKGWDPLVPFTSYSQHLLWGHTSIILWNLVYLFTYSWAIDCRCKMRIILMGGITYLLLLEQVTPWLSLIVSFSNNLELIPFSNGGVELRSSWSLCILTFVSSLTCNKNVHKWWGIATTQGHLLPTIYTTLTMYVLI